MTRRHWLAVCGALVGSSCSREKPTGYDGYALVTTSGDNSLAVVDLTQFRLHHSIPLNGPPTAVVLGPQGRSYVLIGSTGSIGILDSNLSKVSSRKFADELFDLRITSDGTRLFALAAKSPQLIEVDPLSLKVLRRTKLGARPIGFDVAATGRVAISDEQGAVELFDAATGQHSRAALDTPVGVARFRRDGALLLVPNLRDRLLHVIDVPALRPVADLPLAMHPEHLCFNADGGQLFLSGAGMDAIAIVFPYNTLEVEQTVLAGRTPGVMACSSLPAYLFVASRDASNLCILDVDSRKMIGIVEIGDVARHIAITPDSQYALVLEERSGNMAVIRIPAIRGNRMKSGAALFTMIPVGDKPVSATIVPRSA